MILSKRLSVRIADHYFQEETCPSRVDLHRFLQLSAPRNGASCEPFHTIEIDLTQDPKDLLAAMSYQTRYHIRRATDREKLNYEYWGQCSEQQICEFAEFYDRFAIQTKRARLRRQRYELLSKHGFLDLSRVSSGGEVLVWHAHYRDPERARMLESVSMHRETADAGHRTFIGRANRYHHWHDMLRFKEAGCKTYDFGGWYAGKEDQHRLSINGFKEQFGGKVVKHFNCIEGTTFKGKLIARLLSGGQKSAVAGL